MRDALRNTVLKARVQSLHPVNIEYLAVPRHPGTRAPEGLLSLTDVDVTAAIAPGSQVTREQADAITQNIRNALERAYGGIEHAWKVRCDIALGYASWAEYVSAEFDTDHLAVPKAERAALVRTLRDAGMTQQQIAASVNVSQDTVSKDLVKTEGITEIFNSDSPDTPPKPKRGRPRKNPDRVIEPSNVIKPSDPKPGAIRDAREAQDAIAREIIAIVNHATGLRDMLRFYDGPSLYDVPLIRQIMPALYSDLGKFMEGF